MNMHIQYRPSFVCCLNTRIEVFFLFFIFCGYILYIFSLAAALTPLQTSDRVLQFIFVGVQAKYRKT